MPSIRLTEEEKASKKIADIVSDLRLDSEKIGDALGVSQPVEVLNRIVHMTNGMYVSRERFRRRLGLEESAIETLPLFEVEEDEQFEGVTSFSDRCSILSQFWVDYKDDENFEDFMHCYDLGLPLAYSVDSGFIELTEKAVQLVNETWDAFLEEVGKTDEEFSDLSEIMES